jgi:hypothetical protein
VIPPTLDHHCSMAMNGAITIFGEIKFLEVEISKT